MENKEHVLDDVYLGYGTTIQLEKNGNIVLFLEGEEEDTIETLDTSTRNHLRWLLERSEDIKTKKV